MQVFTLNVTEITTIFDVWNEMVVAVCGPAHGYLYVTNLNALQDILVWDQMTIIPPPYAFVADVSRASASVLDELRETKEAINGAARAKYGSATPLKVEVGLIGEGD